MCSVVMLMLHLNVLVMTRAPGMLSIYKHRVEKINATTSRVHVSLFFILTH